MFVSQSVVQSDASECHVRTSEMSELTIDVEKRLREKRNDFVLKQQLSAKSDVWKHFSLVFEKRREDNDGEASGQNLVELKYLCACNRCYRVYRYKSSDGSSFGTKNLLDHVRQCVGACVLTVVRRKALARRQRKYACIRSQNFGIVRLRPGSSRLT